jgi:hypothetical protein
MALVHGACAASKKAEQRKRMLKAALCNIVAKIRRTANFQTETLKPVFPQIHSKPIFIQKPEALPANNLFLARQFRKQPES